jgi:hypothetical protein
LLAWCIYATSRFPTNGQVSSVAASTRAAPRLLPVAEFARLRRPQEIGVDDICSGGSPCRETFARRRFGD